MNTNYKELNFFKRGHELTLEIYKITKEFPKEETYGLSSQLKRASASIGTNIAEGSVRSTRNDFRSFLHNALGSAKEVEYLLQLAKDLGYISVSTYDRLNSHINAVLGPITNYIKSFE